MHIKYPSELAYFGSHIKEKNGVSENFDAADEHKKRHKFSPEQTEPIHNKVTPINDDV